MIKVHKKTFKGIMIGMFIGSFVSVVSLLAVVEKALDTYADIYNYDETIEQADWEKLDSKRELIYNFMETHEIFDKRDDMNYDSIVFQSVLQLYEDDYAVYYNREQAEELITDIADSYKGIGVTISKNGSTNSLTLIDVIEDSPAWKAGLRPGDVCYKVNGDIVTKMSPSELSEIIANSGDAPIKFTVKRLGEAITVEVVREKIDYDYVDYELLEDEIPYIKLDEFSGDASEQFKEAINNMIEPINNKKSIILDLRNNAGGHLDIAADIAGCLLGKDKPLTYIENKQGEQEHFKTSSKQLITDDTHIVILINGMTASASELLVCALQDYDKNLTIIGDTTYGKGIAQRIKVLLDGSAIKYTEGFYYSPDGRNIHNVGIEPDIVELDASEQLELAIRASKGGD